MLAGPMYGPARLIGMSHFTMPCYLARAARPGFGGRKPAQ
ncbi:hypothetical protein NSU_1224 [Novosphingobium pentaromativorans US6-1]|uniref:Uncharacterized protein n=1 Tax=Novosphingobium pentaromativorans US6-1 TaxID=1088721 RepID=G6EA53_9SPHN|nr:hypothetical protein NSU_1224 [Novosphingobium pentaromativorans US6-1]